MATSLKIYLVENSYDTNANTSQVTATVSITASNSYNNYSPSGQITFGGNASGSFTFSKGFDKYTTTVLYTRTFTVAHNADGSGTVTASAYFDTGISDGRITATATLALSKIPQASTIRVLTAGTLEYGDAIRLGITSASSSFRHNVTWAADTHSGTIITNAQGSATFAWNTSADWASWFPNVKTARFTIICETYNGTVKLGETRISVDLTVSGNNPEITSATITDTRGHASKYGAWVNGKSYMQAAIEATAYAGASISEYQLQIVNVGTKTSKTSPVNFGQLGLSSVAEGGQYTVKCTVMDSRGNYGFNYQYIKIVDYTPPSLQGTTVQRWNTSTGQEDDESTTARVSVMGSLCDVNSSGKNTAQVVIQYKLKGSSSWTTANTRSVGTSFAYVHYINGLSNTSQYDFQVIVTDDLGGMAQLYGDVSTATPVMDFKADGQGIAMWATSEYEGLHLEKDLTMGYQKSIYGRNSSGSRFELLRFSNVLTFLTDSLMMPEMFSLFAGSGNPVLNVASDGTVTIGNTGGLNLRWDSSGSIGGHVRETLWTGTCNVGATISVPNNMRYSLFIITLGSDRSKVLAIRENKDGSGSRISGIGGTASSYGDAQWIHSVFFQANSSTSWKLTSSASITHNQSSTNSVHNGLQNMAVTKIEGLI